MTMLIELIDAIAWPFTVLAIVLLYRKQIKEILRRFKRVDFPGGVSVEAFPEEIREAKALLTRVQEEEEENKKKRNVQGPSIPLNEVNARMMNLGLSPSPTGLEFSHYQIIAERDPNLALAGMRMEVETMLKNLAKGFDVTVGNRDGVSVIVRKLQDQGAITQHQAELLTKIIRLGNSAVHGQKVTELQVDDLLDVATVLRDQYVAWLGWGFPEK